MQQLCNWVGGFIVPPTHLELIAVDHCNISCRTCNHASPLVPAWFADPDVVRRDFAILAKSFRPAFVKVLGGEPLMHKRLADVISAARESGISTHFTLTTNGILLDRASDNIWDVIDEIEVSIFPGTPNPDRIVEQARTKAKQVGKKVSVYYYDEFRATFSLAGSTDKGLIKNVFDACKIANYWGCHAVRDGFIYKCPQSIYIRKLVGKNTESDALKIVDDPDFPSALINYLNAKNPLSTCAHCVGTVGRHEDHALVAKSECRAHINKASEAIIDYDLLARSLIAMSSTDDCKVRLKPKHFSYWQRMCRIVRNFRSKRQGQHQG